MRYKIQWKPIIRDDELPQDMVVNTPLGPFGINDKSNPLNQFECEIMITNFKIVKEMIQRLNTTDGIEALYAISPYQVIVCIGKLFDKDKIKQCIELQLTGRIINSYIERDSIPEDLLKKGKKGDLLFPNGELLSVEDEELKKKCCEFVGGVIL